jgi:hypothetical protein
VVAAQDRVAQVGGDGIGPVPLGGRLAHGPRVARGS